MVSPLNLRSAIYRGISWNVPCLICVFERSHDSAENAGKWVRLSPVNQLNDGLLSCFQHLERSLSSARTSCRIQEFFNEGSNRCVFLNNGVDITERISSGQKDLLFLSRKDSSVGLNSHRLFRATEALNL